MMSPFYKWHNLDCWGNPEILSRESFTLLNSHQNRYPLGTDSWIQQSHRAIQQIDTNNHCLLTSIGMNTWDMITWLGGDSGLPMVVIIPCHPQDQAQAKCCQLMGDFHLSPDKTVLVLLPCPRHRPKQFGSLRDTLIVTHAKRIHPISIRPDGRLADLLKGIVEKCKIDTSFQIDWKQDRSCPIRHWKLDAERIRAVIDPHYEQYLIHWTRACAGPWPGETSAEFYRDVFASDSEYARSAHRTLQRIVAEKMIRGSSWRIHGSQRVVSFTALPPSQAISLMKWRKRYVRYTFEPFGIAVLKETALAKGVQPVRYLKPGDQPPSDERSAYCQGIGSKTEWTQEQEYRYLGDYRLEADADEIWQEIDLSSYG